MQAVWQILFGSLSAVSFATPGKTRALSHAPDSKAAFM